MVKDLSLKSDERALKNIHHNLLTQLTKLHWQMTQYIEHIWKAKYIAGCSKWRTKKFLDSY